MNLKNKIIVITGGSTGLGNKLAELFVKSHNKGLMKKNNTKQSTFYLNREIEKRLENNEVPNRSHMREMEI